MGLKPGSVQDSDRSMRVADLRRAMRATGQRFGELLGFAPKWARMRVSEIENGRRPCGRQTWMIVRLLEGMSRRARQKALDNA